MIDIGGGIGKDLTVFLASYPSLRDAVVLQDQPAAIDTARENGVENLGIKPTVHDFFTEQPVKGAKVYYFQSVLHDWADEDCKRILGHVRDAMVRGYSRLLINEVVIPEVGASRLDTGVDMLMMASCGAKERTEKDWGEIITDVKGLKIEQVVRFSGGAIIDCVLI